MFKSHLHTLSRHVSREYPQRSFVLRVSCPIDALDVQAPLSTGEQEAPFVRRTMLTLNRAVRQLVNAIEADSVSNLVNEITHQSAPIVSSNLCEALTQFHDEVLKNSLEISVSWAAISPVQEADSEIEPLRIQRDYFRHIEEVRRALRDTAELIEDTFMGTVEQLNGEMETDGRRSGDVIPALCLSEGEVRRARTNLTADQYEKADKAHMTEGVYVKTAGKLHPGRQQRTLTGITNCEFVQTRHSPA